MKLEELREDVYQSLLIVVTAINEGHANEIMFNAYHHECVVQQERIKELEDINTKLNEEVEHWIDTHGLDVMQLAKKDKRIKELQSKIKGLEIELSDVCELCNYSKRPWCKCKKSAGSNV